MSTNPFDRNRTKEAKLGELITEPGEQNQRDAVHIAVVPIKAAERLRPGEHICFIPGTLEALGTTPLARDRIGIVDPFLTRTVEIGETFWLFLYQGQVTTLRHEWTHPAFPPATQQGREERAASVAWLKQYAARVNPDMGPEAAYDKLIAGLKDKEIHYSGTDMHSRDDLIDAEELQHHAQIVLGRDIDFSDESFSFSCGC